MLHYAPVLWVPNRHHGWAQKLGWKKGGLLRLQRGFCCFKIYFLTDFYNSSAMGATVKLPHLKVVLQITQTLKLGATAATERLEVFKVLELNFKEYSYFWRYRSYWETSTVIVALTSVL